MANETQRPFGWKVEQASTSKELETKLNALTTEGWYIFKIFQDDSVGDFTIICREKNHSAAWAQANAMKKVSKTLKRALALTTDEPELKPTRTDRRVPRLVDESALASVPPIESDPDFAHAFAPPDEQVAAAEPETEAATEPQPDAPSAADLDAVAQEQEIQEETAAEHTVTLEPADEPVVALAGDTEALDAPENDLIGRLLYYDHDAPHPQQPWPWPSTV